MTSTLPNFSASPAAATLAGGSLSNSSALAGFTALSVAPEASAAEFATLLGEGTPTVAVAPVLLVANTSPSVGPGLAPAAPVLEDVACALAVPAVAEPASLPETPTVPALAARAPTDEEVEAAAAFIATLLQAFQHAAPAPVAPQGEAAAAATLAPATTKEFPRERVAVASPLPHGGSFPTPLPASAKPVRDAAIPVDPARPEATSAEAGFVHPNGADFPPSWPHPAQPPLAAAMPKPVEVAPAAAMPRSVLPDEEGATIPPPVNETPSSAPTANATPSLPDFTVAPDGAIACRLDLAATPRPAGAEPKVAPGETAPLEVQAELELPGQAVVRVELHLPQAAPEGRAPRGLPEKFAASAGRKNPRSEFEISPSERNFVFTGDKGLKSDSAVAGIGVAKNDPVMPTVPTDEIRQPRNAETLSALPARAEFQVAQPTAERITVEPAVPAEQNFAERAVATVTRLAEAQFSASMQKAGSVQLRLKFGGEDLSVRVELRGGLVHTDFRTDSPVLREAIATEWQAVAAASPAHLQRFLDPVFSPATPGTLTDSGAQHQSPHRQAQQQGQEQSSSRHDPWSGPSSFTRRSALGESFVPEPATPRTPALLPTSLRLSALA